MIEKFGTPRRSASARVPATSGEVVSKPVAKKTTSREGSSRASASASSGEYTIRTSAPAARASARDSRRPGTRIMSPKVTSVTAPPRASWMAASTSAAAVTHTGHPGPESNWIEPGSSARMPWRKMATVWVPHTSIRRTGRPTARERVAMPLASSSRVGAGMVVNYSSVLQFAGSEAGEKRY